MSRVFCHPCFWLGIVCFLIALAAIITGGVIAKKIENAVTTGDGINIDTKGSVAIDATYDQSVDYKTSGYLQPGHWVSYYYKRPTGDKVDQSELSFAISGKNLTVYGNSDAHASASNYTVMDTASTYLNAYVTVDLCFNWEVAFINITSTGPIAQNYTLDLSFGNPSDLDGICNLARGLLSLGVGTIWLIFGLVGACFCCCALGFFGGWTVNARKSHHHHHTEVHHVVNVEKQPLMSGHGHH